MIKVQVIEEFTFANYNEIKDKLQSNATRQEGRLFVGDIFECNKKTADYLLGDNPIKRAVVRVIEVIPEEIDKNIKTVGLAKKAEEIEAKKETKKSTTKSKKSVAKK